MCGIHGFINGKTKPEINTDDFIKSAFVANMLRGVDSSGIAVVTPEGWVDVAKVPLAGMYLPTNKAAASLISRARAANTASMCHVRAATVGNITYSNAHPFNIEDEQGNEIVGVHNGTLTNWKNKKNATDWEVDSAWALSRILDENADAFEEISGAFAFVWWLSDQPGVLSMARNKERTLFTALTEDGNMVYASEAGMIHWLCERHRIKLTGSIKELEAGYLYKFDIANPSKFTKTILPVASPIVVASSGSSAYHGNNYNNAYGYSHGSAHKTTVEKLDAIFDGIKNEDKKGTQLALVPDIVPDNLITPEEVRDADTMHMLGNKGVFTAMGADDKTGYLYGSFESLEYSGDCHAVMRDVPEDIDWASGGEWVVKVHGIKDSGNDFIILVSRPTGEPVEAAA